MSLSCQVCTGLLTKVQAGSELLHLSNLLTSPTARYSPLPVTLGANTKCIRACADSHKAYLAGGGCREKDLRSIDADRSKRGYRGVYLRGSSNKEWYLP